jgi:hypothetical protein
MASMPHSNGARMLGHTEQVPSGHQLPAQRPTAAPAPPLNDAMLWPPQWRSVGGGGQGAPMQQARGATQQRRPAQPQQQVEVIELD